MSSKDIRPSTLDGIKRLAKSLKREREPVTPHSQALDEAAQVAGYQNFRHAHNVLRNSPAGKTKPLGHRVYLTAYWKDKKHNTSGRETLTLGLSCLWSELMTPTQLKNHRALMHFYVDGLDHLACEQRQSTQSQARRAVCAAARALQFMDATRLRPSKGHSRAFPGGRSSNAIPGHDHYSIWYDSDTKRYLLADEPYEAAAKGKEIERQAWAQKYGFVIVKPTWPGLYAPDLGSRLYLIADASKGVPLEPIATALDRLPPPIVEEAWPGESAPMLPFFVSPSTITRQTATKEESSVARTPTKPRNSVGYVQIFVGPQRRPKGRMPIDVHAEVGSLLKAVLTATYHRKGVYNRVDTVRCELDEWSQREYTPVELPNEQFFELYYDEPGTTFARSLSEIERVRHDKNLMEAKRLLIQHYPDCPPLRSLLKKLDSAQKSLLTWVQKSRSC